MGVERERGGWGEREGKKEGEMRKEQMHKKTNANVQKCELRRSVIGQFFSCTTDAKQR